MNELKFKPIEKMVPNKIMVFYRGDEGSSYVEVSDIDKGVVTSCRPATIESLSFIKKLVVPELKEKTPIKMMSPLDWFLRFDNDINDTNIVWSSKEQVRTINYRGKDVEYHCPALIWVYKGGDDIRVFAKRTRMENRVLHNLPLPNIYENGNICWGDVKIPKFQNSNEVVTNIPKLFFESAFTDHLNKNGCKVPIDEFLEMELKVQHGCYVKSKLTTDDFLRCTK